MMTQTADGGGRGGVHSLGSNRDLDHGQGHDHDRNNRIFFWPDAVVPPRVEIDRAITAPNGGGGGDTRHSTTD